MMDRWIDRYIGTQISKWRDTYVVLFDQLIDKNIYIYKEVDR